MDVRRLASDLSVSGQITPSELPEVAGAGFRAVICNRPDGEGADQPSFAEIEAAARAAGLEIRYVPVVPGHVSDEDVTAFGAALVALPKPILAYCRTGMRAATLWSLSEAACPSLRESACNMRTLAFPSVRRADAYVAGSHCAGSASRRGL